ncbi:hypothetical protein AK812_SmicGene4093 [Symbiodinium microadriaticum]|uniref:Uncharacterized protein n=1 Tax=Symbiodinium microadriaticum TaxID=2951 RepID=A0A1Q9EX36_SYMMI|nr:hypothetical protein AK812_SmicGene4093 [Symbiodinium microadriaticum]
MGSVDRCDSLNSKDSEEFGVVTKSDSLQSDATAVGLGIEKVESLCSLDSLPTTLDPELIQGVPLSVCLSGWGKFWAATTPAPVAKRLSRRTAFYDTFLSHDWRTPRWLKFIALVVIFNSRAAALASAIVSLAVGVLRATGVLPDELWTVIFGYATFYIFLLVWQRIRDFVLRPQIVFLDKLCIDQHDERLKEKGIMGLAGFLDNTRKLTVLWSPQYFSRLWCTYELATFLRNPDQHKPLEVMPVRMCYLLFLMAFCWRILLFAYYVLIASPEILGPQAATSLRQIFPVLVIVILPMHFYKGLSLMKHIRMLPQQLQNFRVQDAQCFCCSNDHRHPESQKPLPCDRQLVFNTLRQWYGEVDEDPEGHLETFNAMVRDVMSNKMMKAACGETLPFHYAFYMVVTANIPWLTECVAQIGAGPPIPLEGFRLLVWSLRTFMDWAHMCLMMLCAMRCCVALWSRGVEWLERLPQLLVVLLLIPVQVLVMALAWIPFQLCLTLTEPDNLLPIVPFLAVLAFDVYIFKSQAQVGLKAPTIDSAPREELASKVRRLSERQKTEEEFAAHSFSA